MNIKETPTFPDSKEKRSENIGNLNYLPQTFLTDDEIDDEFEGYDNGEGYFEQQKADTSPEVVKNAEELLEDLFSEYDPESEGSDIGFFSAAYKLDRLFFPDSLPENSGSLDDSILDFIEPIVSKLSIKYPQAAKRFYGLFDRPYNPMSTLGSSHLYNPYRYIENRKKVETYYRELLLTEPQKVLDFAFKAIDSQSNYDVGLVCAAMVIEEKGWEFVINQALFGGEARYFTPLKECLYSWDLKYPINEAESQLILNNTNNDIEWINISSYLSVKQKTLNCELLDDQVCMQILRDSDMPFYDVEKTRGYATRLLEQNYEVHKGLLEELHLNLRRMWTNYEGEPDSLFIKETMQNYASLEPKELLASIYPVFAFNLLVQALPDNESDLHMYGFEKTKNEIVRDVILDSEKIHEEVREAMKKDRIVYSKAFFETSFQLKSSSSPVLQMSRYDYGKYLSYSAEHEGLKEQDVFGYIINCSATSLGKGLVGLYSPSGRLVRMLQTNEETNLQEKPSKEIADLYSIKHVLADLSFTQKEKATAIAVIWWDYIPDHIRSYIEEIYESYGIEIESFLSAGEGSFESCLWFTSDIAPLFPNDAVIAIEEFIEDRYVTLTGELAYPEEVDRNKLAVLIENEGSMTSVHEDEIADRIESLSFDTIKMLQENFKINFSTISKREVFSLIKYLMSQKHGDGFNKIKSFTRGDVDEELSRSQIRVFLSLEKEYDTSLGDAIIAFGQHKEIAGKVFRYYGELLDSADRAEALVREVSNCEGESCIDLGNQVRENIINRAQKDLEKAVRSQDPSEVAAQIENYVVAAKEYVALLQEIGAGKIESVSPGLLTEEERGRMQELMHSNYDKVYPGPENEQFKNAVAGSLTKSFSNPNTTFHVLRDNGEIVSYNRFDTLSDHTGREVSYFGSFNADPAYSGVGGVMLEETIKYRLEDGRPMMAHCDPAQPITKKYIEDGFVATQLLNYSGVPAFEIWRSKDSTTQLKSKEKSIEELLASAEETGSIVVREQSDAETYPELQNNMGLTRYFTHQGKTYLVFEQLPDNLRNDFTPPKEDLKEVA